VKITENLREQIYALKRTITVGAELSFEKSVKLK
jgi:hypothetical protein